jgi:hypothetical protein
MSKSAWWRQMEFSRPVRPTHAEKSGATPPPPGEDDSVGSGAGVSLGSADSEAEGESLGLSLSETLEVGVGSSPDEETRWGAAFAMVPAIRTAASTVSMSRVVFMLRVSAAAAPKLEPAAL